MITTIFSTSVNPASVLVYVISKKEMFKPMTEGHYVPIQYECSLHKPVYVHLCFWNRFVACIWSSPLIFPSATAENGLHGPNLTFCMQCRHPCYLLQCMCEQYSVLRVNNYFKICSTADACHLSSYPDIFYIFCKDNWLTNEMKLQ